MAPVFQPTRRRYYDPMWEFLISLPCDKRDQEDWAPLETLKRDLACDHRDIVQWMEEANRFGIFVRTTCEGIRRYAVDRRDYKQVLTEGQIYWNATR